MNFKLFCQIFLVVFMLLRFWKNANKEIYKAKDIVPMFINFFEIIAFFHIINYI